MGDRRGPPNALPVRPRGGVAAGDVFPAPPMGPGVQHDDQLVVGVPAGAQIQKMAAGAVGLPQRPAVLLHPQPAVLLGAFLFRIGHDGGVPVLARPPEEFFPRGRGMERGAVPPGRRGEMLYQLQVSGGGGFQQALPPTADAEMAARVPRDRGVPFFDRAHHPDLPGRPPVPKSPGRGVFEAREASVGGGGFGAPLPRDPPDLLLLPRVLQGRDVSGPRRPDHAAGPVVDPRAQAADVKGA